MMYFQRKEARIVMIPLHAIRVAVTSRVVDYCCAIHDLYYQFFRLLVQILAAMEQVRDRFADIHVPLLIQQGTDDVPGLLEGSRLLDEKASSRDKTLSVRISMGLLPVTYKCGLRMRRECRECFPRHRLQRKPLVSDPGMHHMPWCMLGSRTHGAGENVPGIPGACASRNFTYLARDPCHDVVAIIFTS